MDRLEGLHRVDAAVVGGGLTGLLLASSLAHEGLKVAVIDAGEGFSGPERAAASLFDPPFARIKAIHGTDTAQQYALALQGELQELLCAPPAYVQEMPGYLYARMPEEHPLLERRVTLLTELGLPVSIAPDAGGCPFPVELSLTLPGQSIVHVQRWMAALEQAILRQGGQLYHGSRVTHLERSRVFTGRGCVQTGRIVLATGKPPGLRTQHMLALLESRTQVWNGLTSFLPLHSLQIPLAAEGLTLIPHPGGIIVQGSAGRAGCRDAQTHFRRFLQQVSALLPDHIQGTTGAIRAVHSLDGLPLIGTLPGSSALMAAGIHGPLGAMHAARVLTRRILGRTQPEDRIYAPDRFIPGRILRPALLRNAARYASGWLHPSAPECSLCGCLMRYLSPASRWDCPYCGSAFTMLGHVIDGPAVRPARLSVRQRPDL